MKNMICLSVVLLSLQVSAQKIKVDLLIYNAKIYMLDDKFSTASAIVIKDGKIEDIGSTKNLAFKYIPSQSINALGQFMYPGFIDAHTHFVSYGLGLQTAELTGTTSWEQVIEKVQTYAQTHPDGWLIGRGWDQNDWSNKDFPSKEKLDQLFPNRPVILTRVDGHAAIVNQKALETAGINAATNISGGQVETKNGQLTGILLDNAIGLVRSKIPEPNVSQMKNALLDAQKNCFAAGLTTVDDCGLDFRHVAFIEQMQKDNELKMRIYAMLSDDPRNYEYLFARGKIKTDYLNVRSFKVYADGALGSRGAALLQPYSDKPGWSGFLLNTPQHFDSVARIIAEHGFQMCTHAIGDSGNRVILKTYAKYLKGKNDLRWRIEHAQVVNQDDFNYFGAYSIIPSVQPTHATSDMYWAGDRLGPARLEYAYAYQHLLEQNQWLALGTDFPVEDISPIRTFYAAVFRMDDKGYPPGGFQKDNALSRVQALQGMTIWAARSNFEEQEKGSLEKGKFADFVILDKDLMKIDATEVLSTKVLRTYVNGKRVYQKD